MNWYPPRSSYVSSLPTIYLSSIHTMAPLFSTSPPPPSFTPASIVDLSTKICIISSLNPTTLHLARVLYNLHATVYLGCPCLPTFNSAADKLRKSCPDSMGSLKPFLFAAAAPESIEIAVQQFSQQEWRLNVLFLSADGGDLLVAFALAKLLSPVLHKTASQFCHPNPSIRVIWITPSSCLPWPSGTLDLSTADKVYLLADAFSRLPPPSTNMEKNLYAHTLPNSNPSGVQHVCVTAELAQSKLQRSMRRFVPAVFNDELEKSVCTLLYAALGPDVRSRDWVVPWGRKGAVPEFVREGAAGKNEKVELSSASLYALHESYLTRHLGR
ncbi:hypothetical protein FB567DRAFT_530931 [Paraphoma chrysanthemicola]|uniref:Uncharacterized protein n=1 Tax=Paraphoma chrysanthemicola TaxID=798071 RepID=A0A8K0R025_9PLEO|nr:hypothetical protein FB567DRAFT_530931 [Paraphoma chrysanthemicola]